MFQSIAYWKPPSKREPTFPGGRLVLTLTDRKILGSKLTLGSAEKVFGKAIYISEHGDRFTFNAPCGVLILAFRPVSNMPVLEEIEIGCLYLLIT
jgi:hypothetical protein